MKGKRFFLILFVVVLAASLLAGLALADDGQMFRRNISKTPQGETEKAATSMMGFYVPAQSSDGTLLTEGIDYYDANGVLVETRDYAKPLVSVYIDGIDEEEEEVTNSIQAITTGVNFGRRDAFSALSLDDGATWKKDNLSRSADLSSFILANGHEYPGDVPYMVMAVAGDRVLAGWLSKYCESGSPLYSYTDEEIDALRTAYPGLPDMYVADLFGVSGNQDSVDYTLQGFPEVGEIPYSCVWTARGEIVYDDESQLYDILWTKAERITSGRRDADRLEMAGEVGAGFMMVWQEDPEGLRPGKGLGPGEGWSGAIVNNKTDIWYSYIGWDEFDDVVDDAGTPYILEDYPAELTMPKIAVPMAMPVRMTDNNMCKAEPKYDTNGALLDPYCYADFDVENQTFTLYEGPNGNADFCANSISWTNPGETTLNLCQTADGRVLWGRTGSARARLTLKGYDQDGDGVFDSAWVVLAYEELKALGNEVDEETLDPIDIGKNVWYHTFDMFKPDIVEQGLMLNQPAYDPTTGELFPTFLDEWNNEMYETEISRRFNIMTQYPSKAGDSGTVGMLIYKQGIINQGGPADIYLRRIVIPEDSEEYTFNPATDNPYAYENIECADRILTDGSNPNYVHGVCLSPAINISGNTIVECDNGTSGADCAALFPWDGGETYPKVTEWVQTEENLDDQSWENPYDVAKGHRGFIDGDFIMMMYAWAPNWKANTVGNDHYNLYVRRSFDGGVTWTTLPANYTHVDGTTWSGSGTESCEWYGHGSEVYEECTTYGAGEFEQARNVSQLVGNKITVLDPRYTPSGGPREFQTIGMIGDATKTPLYEDDTRDPSRFFIIYETGDNTVVEDGGAVPLDLFFSRGYDFGDDYDYVDFLKDKDGDGQDELYQEWDWLENQLEDLSGEASVTSNPGATFFYSVWNQWREDEHEQIYDSDIWFRRVMYLDDTDSAPIATILYTSGAAVDLSTGSLTLVGTAVDSDHLGDGVVDYLWTSSLDGELGHGKQLTLPVGQLTEGLHTISFSALDAEGNWSREATVPLLVADELSTIRLPIVTNR